MVAFMTHSLPLEIISVLMYRTQSISEMDPIAPPVAGYAPPPPPNVSVAGQAGKSFLRSFISAGLGEGINMAGVATNFSPEATLATSTAVSGVAAYMLQRGIFAQGRPPSFKEAGKFAAVTGASMLLGMQLYAHFPNLKVSSVVPVLKDKDEETRRKVDDYIKIAATGLIVFWGFTFWARKHWVFA
jgi:hypothetical protein